MGPTLKFDLKFIEDKIIEGERILKDSNSSLKIISQVELMLYHFYEILNINPVFTDYNEHKLTLDEMCLKLNKKITKDLKMFEDKNLLMIHNFCSNNYKKFNYDSKDFYHPNNTDMVEEIIEFYEEINYEFSKIIKSIFENKNSLINLDKMVQYDHTFYCEFLSLPFISVNNQNRMYPVWLVHELNHGIEYIKYTKIPFLSNEVGSIFFETLYIDKLNQKYNNKYVSFYLERLNYINKSLQILNEYFELILRYKTINSDINKSNIEYLLQADSGDISNQYFKVITNNYLNNYKYLFSFLQSLELRDIFNNDKKQSLLELEKILEGKKNFMNFDKFNNLFNNYSNKVKTLNKK